MRVITSMGTACCLSLLVAAAGAPAVAAAQLDSGTGLQASKEVASPPPAASGHAGVRAGSAGNRNRMSQAQAARRTAPVSSSGGSKNTPP